MRIARGLLICAISISSSALAAPTTPSAKAITPAPSATSAPAPSSSDGRRVVIAEASTEAILAEAEKLARDSRTQQLLALTNALELLRQERRMLQEEIQSLQTQRDATTDPSKKAAISAQIAKDQTNLDTLDHRIDAVIAQIAAIRAADDAAREENLRVRSDALQKLNDSLASNAEVRDAAGKLVSTERRAALVARVTRSTTETSQALRAFATARTLPKPKPPK